MSESEFVEDLKWVHRQCEESDDEIGDAHGIAQEYNRVLESLQEEHQDNEAIQQLDPVQTASGMGRSMRLNPGTLSEMKSGARRLLRELGSEVPEVSSQPHGKEGAQSQQPVIENNNYLFANQDVSVEQVVDIDTIVEQVDDEKTRQLIEVFREEMNGNDPDGAHLQSLYEKIYAEAGKPIATSLAASALLRGFDIALSSA